MALTGKGRTIRTAWAYRQGRKPGAAFLSKMVRWSDTDTADSVYLQDFFWPLPGAAYVLIAAVAAFTYTGNAAPLKVDNRMPAITAAFNLTGPATALRRADQLPTVTASYTETGNSAALRAARQLSVVKGTFNWTGIAAALRAARYLHVDWAWNLNQRVQGLTVTPTAEDATLDWLALGQALFVTTGKQVGLPKGYTLSAATRSYVFTANQARLFKTPAALIAEAPLGVPVSLMAAAGVATVDVSWQPGASFLMIGNNAGLKVDNRLPVTKGTFVLTGNNVGSISGITLTATKGTFTYTGNAAALRKAEKLNTVAAAFNLTANDTGLIAARNLPLIVGVFTMNGTPAILSYTPTYVLHASTGAFSTTITDVALTATRTLITLPGEFHWTGVNTSLYSGFIGPNEPFYIDLKTGETFANFNTGKTEINISTGQTFIDLI